MDNEPRQTAHFWFDPICPWAWLTSRWMLQVREVRPVDIEWHVMSLAILNSGRELPEEYVELMARAWIPVRTVIAAERDHGAEIVLPLYTAMGERIHVQGVEDYELACRQAVAELGLTPALVDIALTDEVDDALGASHAEAMALVGDDVGTPVVAVPGEDGVLHGIFGPIVTPIPRGEAAGRLWDATVTVLTTPGVYELKRTRGVGPIFD